MKRVYQTDLSDTTGDCVRACIASVFELQIDDIPNFWTETQNCHEFWEKLNEWMYLNLKHRTVLTKINGGDENFIRDVLCVAIGELPHGGEHAVVWKNGTIHNPIKNCTDFVKSPSTFLFFVPIDINIGNLGSKIDNEGENNGDTE